MTDYFAKITGSKANRDSSPDGSDGHNNTHQRYSRNSDYIRRSSPEDTGYQTNHPVMQRLRDLSAFWLSSPISENPGTSPGHSLHSGHDTAIIPSQIENTSTNLHSNTPFSSELQPSEILPCERESLNTDGNSSTFVFETPDPSLQNTYFDLPKINRVQDHFFSDFASLLANPNLSADEVQMLAHHISSGDPTIALETSDETRARLLAEAMQPYRFIEEDPTQYPDTLSSSDKDDIHKIPAIRHKKKIQKISHTPQEIVAMPDQLQSTSTRKTQLPKDTKNMFSSSENEAASDEIGILANQQNSTLDRNTSKTSTKSSDLAMGQSHDNAVHYTESHHDANQTFSQQEQSLSSLQETSNPTSKKKGKQQVNLTEDNQPNTHPSDTLTASQSSNSSPIRFQADQSTLETQEAEHTSTYKIEDYVMGQVQKRFPSKLLPEQIELAKQMQEALQKQRLERQKKELDYQEGKNKIIEKINKRSRNLSKGFKKSTENMTSEQIEERSKQLSNRQKESWAKISSPEERSARAGWDKLTPEERSARVGWNPNMTKEERSARAGWNPNMTKEERSARVGWNPNMTKEERSARVGWNPNMTKEERSARLGWDPNRPNAT